MSRSPEATGRRNTRASDIADACIAARTRSPDSLLHPLTGRPPAGLPTIKRCFPLVEALRTLDLTARPWPPNPAQGHKRGVTVLPRPADFMLPSPAHPQPDHKSLFAFAYKSRLSFWSLDDHVYTDNAGGSRNRRQRVLQARIGSGASRGPGPLVRLGRRNLHLQNPVRQPVFSARFLRCAASTSPFGNPLGKAAGGSSSPGTSKRIVGWQPTSGNRKPGLARQAGHRRCATHPAWCRLRRQSSRPVLERFKLSVGR